jgi:CRP/FNR family cyclic AMP-dependent transcriptional regulator
MTPVDEFANSPFLRRNSPEVWKSIAHLSTPQSFEKGQTIYHQGDHTSQLFYLESGRVKIFTIEPGGLERLMTIIEPGNTFGEAAAFDRHPHYVSAVAMIPSRTRAFDTDRLSVAMTQDVTLLRAVVDELAHKQRILALQAESMTFYSLSERVALLLSHLSASYGTNAPDGTGRRVHIDVPLADLASILGLSRITMSREIAKLVKAGIVAKNGRDILILDLAALSSRMPEVSRAKAVHEPSLDVR